MTPFADSDRAPVVVAGHRTPFVRSGTEYRHLTAYDLARIAVHGLVERTQIETEVIQHGIFGCIANHPKTTNVARQAMIGAGLPLVVPAHTVTMGGF